MKKYIFLFLTFALAACQQQQTFTIEGAISNAAGETIYLEHTALLKTAIVDSCLINNDGTFALTAQAPAYPDFYRLRIATASLPLAIDSTEHIVVKSTRDSLPHTLCIEGSAQSLSIAQLRTIARNATIEDLRKATQDMIVANPASLAAYYAVFMKKDGQYLWDMYNPSDRRMYQAVATSYQTWMPNYERTKALYAQVSDILNAERKAKQQVAMRQLIDQAENSIIDITLPDNTGKQQTLSNLKGKLVVLDFSAIEMQKSQAYIFELREIYNTYKKRGLEIYSISLDRNKLLWEDGVANLPWINVYAGEQTTDVLMRYNVQNLPTLFLLDRKGNVQGRYSSFEQLDADIRKYL